MGIFHHQKKKTEKDFENSNFKVTFAK